MPHLRHTTQVPPRLSLVLHTAIDFVPCQGIGVGIIQRSPTGAARNNIFPIEKRKYSVKRSQFSAENVKTQNRAYMFAILHAMGLARGTIKRRCTATIRIRSVTVLCDSSTVVDLIAFHRDHSPASLENVRSTNDRSMIKRVLKGIRELSRRAGGVDVVIAENGQESSSKETRKTKTMARQKGRKACRSRRQAQRIASIETETAGNQTGSGAEQSSSTRTKTEGGGQSQLR